MTGQHITDEDVIRNAEKELKKNPFNPAWNITLACIRNKEKSFDEGARIWLSSVTNTKELYVYLLAFINIKNYLLIKEKDEKIAEKMIKEMSTDETSIYFDLLILCMANNIDFLEKNALEEGSALTWDHYKEVFDNSDNIIINISILFAERLGELICT